MKPVKPLHSESARRRHGGERGSTPRADDAERIRRLGARIRALRKEQGLTLKALAQLSGLSHPFLSQVERGLAPAVDEFAAPDLRGARAPTPPGCSPGRRTPGRRRWSGRRTPRVVPASELGDMDGVRRVVAPEASPLPGRGVQRRARLVPGSTGSTTASRRIYVISGTVEVDLDGEVFLLEPSDSISYRHPPAAPAAGRDRRARQAADDRGLPWIHRRSVSLVCGPVPSDDRDEAENPAISARGLVRTFGSNRAVDGVNLTVESGEIYGFLGPNGAGKSTTVRMLCTLLKPTEGAGFGGRPRRGGQPRRGPHPQSASPSRTPPSTSARPAGRSSTCRPASTG